MFPSDWSQQFEQNSDNQEIINLQKHLASFEKRLDELETNKSKSDGGLKIGSLQDDLNNLQRQFDNMARTGRQEVQALVNQFNLLKSRFEEVIESLKNEISGLKNRAAANENYSRKIDCMGHLDGHRFSAAASVADKMTSEEVIEIIRQYCSPYEKYNERKAQAINEFINCMANSSQRGLYKSVLNEIGT